MEIQIDQQIWRDSMGFLDKIEKVLRIKASTEHLKGIIEEQKKEIETFKKDLNISQKMVEEKMKEINRIEKEQKKIVEESTFLMDFIKLDAFSIERTLNEGKAETVIGYIDRKDEVKEWYLSCSTKTHEDLCDLFKKQILLKDTLVKNTE